MGYKIKHVDYMKPDNEDIFKNILDPYIDKLFDNMLNENVVLTDNETFSVTLSNLDKANNTINFNIKSLKRNKTIVSTILYEYWVVPDIYYQIYKHIYHIEYSLRCRIKSINLGLKTIDCEHDSEEWFCLLGGYSEKDIRNKYRNDSILSIYDVFEESRKMKNWVEKVNNYDMYYALSDDTLTSLYIEGDFIKNGNSLDIEKVKEASDRKGFGSIYRVYLLDDVVNTPEYSSYKSFENYFYDMILNYALKASAEAFKTRKEQSLLTKTGMILKGIGEFLALSVEIGGTVLCGVAVGTAAIRHPFITGAVASKYLNDKKS